MNESTLNLCSVDYDKDKKIFHSKYLAINIEQLDDELLEHFNKIILFNIKTRVELEISRRASDKFINKMSARPK